MALSPEDILELQEAMSLTRLAKIGLFQKMDIMDGLSVRREIILHRAVLDKALVDSFSVYPTIKKEVDDWLRLSNLNFREACERAALEPELVFKTFKIMHELLQGDKGRFKKLGKKKKKHVERDPA